MLSFLQQGLERRLSPSTLKVYVAAIAANHNPVEGKSVWKHDWVIRFLRGDASGSIRSPPPPPHTLLGPVSSAHSTHFSLRFVPRVWTSGFPDNPEAPARLFAQGSHYSLQSRLIFSIFNIITTGVIRTFSASYHQLLNYSNLHSLAGWH